MNVAQLQAELIRDEDLRLKAYKDSKGIWTLGVGHNIEDRPISRRAALIILEDDIDDAMNDLDRSLPWWKTLDEVRQRVLANMCFNLGITRLLGFSKALAAMQDGEYSRAADEMRDSAWFRQVGQRATRLCNLMRDGK